MKLHNDKEQFDGVIPTSDEISESSYRLFEEVKRIIKQHALANVENS